MVKDKGSKVVAKASVASILGRPPKVDLQKPKDGQPICYVCLKPIPEERMAALLALDTPKDEWCHVECSVVEKKQGIFLGEVGTSKLLVVKKVYQDSVRDMFSSPEAEEEGE